MRERFYEENAGSWVAEYLKKHGEDIDEVLKAVYRMPKARVMERFKGWGLVTAHSKNDMMSIIQSELENNGFKPSFKYDFDFF